MKKINFNKLNNRGFALIELIIVIALIALAFMGIYNLFSGGTKAWITGSSQINAQQNVRFAMDKMIREIRQAGYGVTTGDKITLTLEEPSKIEFRADLNSDGTPEKICYYLNLDTGVIYKRIGDGGSGIPITNSEYSINNLNFKYTEENKLITIDIEVDRNKNGVTDFTLNSEVKPRNL